MRRIFAVILAVGWMSGGVAIAETRISDRTVVEFATVEAGRRVLTAEDEYVVRLSPFDRAARLKTDREVGVQEYLAFVGRNVLPWADAERHKLEAILEGLRPRLEPYAAALPKTVLLIKTTGAEEG